MPELIEVGATIMCPHGGQVKATPGNPRVKLGGKPATTLADMFMISGCPFMMGTKPSPCIMAQWMTQATKVLIGGQPAILKSSSALCKSPEQIPQGPPNIAVTQLKVKGQ